MQMEQLIVEPEELRERLQELSRRFGAVSELTTNLKLCRSLSASKCL